MQASSGPVVAPHPTQVHRIRWRVLRGLVAAAGAAVLLGSAVATPTAASPRPDDPGAPGGGGRAKPAYGVVVRDLGRLGVGWQSRPVAVNDRGQVAATAADESGRMRVVLWTPGRGMRNLGQGAAVDLNDQGQVLVTDRDRVLGADVLWDPRRGRISLGALGGTATRASDLNDRGEVVGSTSTADGRSVAFLWSRARGMRELRGLGGTGSGAVRVNDHGVVAGTATEADGTERVVVWRAPHRRPERVGDRGDRVPLPTGRGPTVADLTEGGRLLGNSSADSGVFVWDRARGARLLGCWDGMSCDALDMNERGTVVGGWQAPMLDIETAYVWSPRGGLRVLTTDEETFAYDARAVAVDDAGRVVGNAQSWLPEVDGAFWWTERAGLQHLPDLGAGRAEVVALGRHGRAVGVAPGPDGSVHLVMWVLGPRCR